MKPGERHEKPNYKDKCYKTKEDKRHATFFSFPAKIAFDKRQIASDAQDLQLKHKREQEEVKQKEKMLKERLEKCSFYQNGVNTCSLSERCSGDLGRFCVTGSTEPRKTASSVLWNPQWTVLSCGKSMSRGELKEYCKVNGKTWENE